MPGIVDQPLPSLNIGVIGGHVIGADRQSIAGQIEEAGSAMIGDAASVINLEAAKTARDALLILRGTDSIVKVEVVRRQAS